MEELPDILREVEACRICRDNPIAGSARLPHEPRPVCVASASARILIAGQAPGLRVHESGIPFADASGDRLRDWLGVDDAVFHDRERIAIVPMGFCFPGYDDRGSDLPPRRECRLAWRDRIMAAMPRVELVIAIGRHAQRYHLADRCRPTVTETVSAWRAISAETSCPRVLPLPHPSWRNSAWLKRNPWFATELLPFLRGEVARLTR